jgi:hypothetical protein
MTQSQLLNDKQEVIHHDQPTLNTKKYIILAIVLTILLSTIAYFTLKTDKSQLKKLKKAEEKRPKAAK